MYQQKCTVAKTLNMKCDDARSWCVKNADLPKKIEEKAIEAGKGKTVSYYGKARGGMLCALAAFRSMVVDDEKGFRTWSREYRLLETSIRFFFGKDRYVSYNDFTDSEVPPLKDYLDFDNPYGNIVTNEILEEVFYKIQGNYPLFRLEVDIEKNEFSIISIIESEKNTAKTMENNFKLEGGAGENIDEISYMRSWEIIKKARLAAENTDGTKVSNVKLAGGARLVEENTDGGSKVSNVKLAGGARLIK